MTVILIRGGSDNTNCWNLKNYKNGIKTDVAEKHYLIGFDYRLHYRPAIYVRISVERRSEAVVAPTLNYK
jgi:hypothetical protein